MGVKFGYSWKFKNRPLGISRIRFRIEKAYKKFEISWSIIKIKLIKQEKYSNCNLLIVSATDFCFYRLYKGQTVLI